MCAWLAVDVVTSLDRCSVLVVLYLPSVLAGLRWGFLLR